MTCTCLGRVRFPTPAILTVSALRCRDAARILRFKPRSAAPLYAMAISINDRPATCLRDGSAEPNWQGNRRANHCPRPDRPAKDHRYKEHDCYWACDLFARGKNNINGGRCRGSAAGEGQTDNSTIPLIYFIRGRCRIGCLSSYPRPKGTIGSVSAS